VGYHATSRRGMGKLRGRRLGSTYDSAYSGYVGLDPSIPGSPAQLQMDTGSSAGIDPLANCSTFDQLLFQLGWSNLSCMTAGANAAGKAQIQSVVQNAVAAGYPPNVIAAIQQEAAAQEAQVPSDTSVILSGYNTPAASLSTWPWYAWAAIAFVGIVVIKR
jgi:hypothetical protein